MSVHHTRQTREAPKKRSGLVKMRSEAQIRIVDSTGKASIVVVRRMEDWPNAKKTVRCTGCRGEWANPDAMVSAHPEHRVMDAAGDVHLWGWYSEEMTAKPEKLLEKHKGMSPEEDWEVTKQNRAIEARNASIGPIGFLSDEALI